MTSSLLHPPNFIRPYTATHHPSLRFRSFFFAFLHTPTINQPTNQPHAATQRTLWTLNHNSCSADVVGRWRRSSLSFYSPNSFPFFLPLGREFSLRGYSPMELFFPFCSKTCSLLFLSLSRPATTSALASVVISCIPPLSFYPKPSRPDPWWSHGRYRMRERGVARPSGVGFTVAGNHRWQPSVLHLPSEPLLCSFCESLKKDIYVRCALLHDIFFACPFYVFFTS